MERQIVVKGQSQARSMPDRAVLVVTVDAEGPTRQQAYAEAAGSAGQVDKALDERASATGRVITATLMVYPKNRWKKGESIRTGWRASRATTVEVTDFSQLGVLIAELTAAGGAVSGPSWRVDDDNPVYREARRGAAEDARRRAEDYAAALGLVIDGVAWVAEPGLRDSSGSGGPFMAGMAAPEGGAMRSRDPDEVIDVTPDEITTVAEVEVGFALRSEGG